MMGRDVLRGEFLEEGGGWHILVFLLDGSGLSFCQAQKRQETNIHQQSLSAIDVVICNHMRNFLLPEIEIGNSIPKSFLSSFHLYPNSRKSRRSNRIRHTQSTISMLTIMK